MPIVNTNFATSFNGGTITQPLTINDPKTYTQPWISKASIKLSAGTEMGEYFCVPSDEEGYLKAVRERAGKAANQ